MKTVGLTFPAPEPIPTAPAAPAVPIEPEEAPADTTKAKVKK